MIRLFFVLIFTAFAFAANAQDVKKMSISNLEEYILKSEKPVVINFWATFCKPCLDEIPYFQQTISNDYKGEVELILVSLDMPEYYPEKISSVASRSNFIYPVVWLNETDADYFCPKIDVKWSGAIPATLMVNNKRSYRKFYGQQLTPLQLKRELKVLCPPKL
jgi:thiol-disulfide isomerase/thioredoxin